MLQRRDLSPSQWKVPSERENDVGIRKDNPVVDGIPWIPLLLIKVVPNPLVTKTLNLFHTYKVSHTESKGQLNKTKNFERRRVSETFT